MVQKAGASWTGPRLSGGVLFACAASFQAPEWKRVSPFLAAFSSSRCSFSMHRPVPSLACFHFHARPAILRCVALLGLAASLARSVPSYLPIQRCPAARIRCCSNSYQCSSLLFFIDRWSQILATVLPILSLAVRMQQHIVATIPMNDRGRMPNLREGKEMYYIHACHIKPVKCMEKNQ